MESRSAPLVERNSGASRAPLKIAIITAARNEKENLSKIFNSVKCQRSRPELWVVIDDNSSDGTFDEATELSIRNNWIRVLRMESPNEIRSDRIFRVFEFGIQYLKNNDLEFDLIMKLDADTVIPQNYLEDVVEFFRQDARLGIASGINAGEWTMSHHLRGNNRIYRWSCLKNLDLPKNGFGQDTVDLIKARFGGWSTKVFPQLVCIHLRGRKKDLRYTIALGKTSRHLGYYFWYAIGRAALILVKQGVAHTLAFLLGYVANGYGSADEETKRLVRKDQNIRLRTMLSNAKLFNRSGGARRS